MSCCLQFGGQTPLKISTALQQALDENPIPAASGNGNVAVWGTQPDAIDEAEDRDRWVFEHKGPARGNPGEGQGDGQGVNSWHVPVAGCREADTSALLQRCHACHATAVSTPDSQDASPLSVLCPSSPSRFASPPTPIHPGGWPC